MDWGRASTITTSSSGTVALGAAEQGQLVVQSAESPRRDRRRRADRTRPPRRLLPITPQAPVPPVPRSVPNEDEPPRDPHTLIGVYRIRPDNHYVLEQLEDDPFAATVAQQAPPTSAGRRTRDTARAMSQENVELVRKVFAAFDRGDIEAVLRLCDEDIVITQPAEVPGIDPQQRGHQGVLEAFAIWPEQWDDFRVEVLGLTAAPADKVIANIRTLGRGRQSGVEVDMEFSFVFTVRDEKIIEWQLFLREDQALEAAGLRE
jgi:ketosteroid isomerase-like protein